MSDQLLDWDESEHERTGGPAYCTEGCCAAPDIFCNVEADNTPLQEQVEQQDAHIFQLEDALSKSVDVIAALMGERKDLHDQVYQAQLDAQNWQNQFRTVQAQRVSPDDDICECQPATTSELNAELIRGLTNRVLELEGQLKEFEAMRARVYQLTHDNTQLELRNERQAKRGEYARQVLAGVWDTQMNMAGYKTN